jgi:diaminopropionate ammonia-lyase
MVICMAPPCGKRINYATVAPAGNAVHRIGMLGPHPFTLFANPRTGTPGITVLPEAGFRRARAEITAWPGYAPTPLLALPEIAAAAGLGVLRLKDEAGRFGLGSFKALGGAYAVAELLAGELARRGVAPAATSAELLAGRWSAVTETVTVTCATDGNHGRAVAWGARRCHCRSVIFVHEGVSTARAAAIAAHRAEIRRVPGTYDDSVRIAAAEAAANGWFVVSDTSWECYTEVPRAIMQGYRVMADEAVAQWGAAPGDGAPPTHVFIQGGVGGVAAAVSVQARTAFSPAPMLVVVEPDRAACLLASAELGERTSVSGDLDTLMAGLACGEPSLLAWQELDRGAAAFMAIPDDAAVATMRLLAQAGVVAGESGVAGLAGCLLAAADPAAREVLGLGEGSRVLVFSTEGATDPELYARLVEVSVN